MAESVFPVHRYVSARLIFSTAAGKAELFAGGGRNRKDGLAKEIRFSSLAGIAIDSSDNLYVADGTRIRKITPEGFVTTIAGSEISGYKDGDRSIATFVNLENIAIDNKGTIYVTDNEFTNNRGSSGHHVIRKISAEGIVTTIKNGNEAELRVQGIGHRSSR